MKIRSSLFFVAVFLLICAPVFARRMPQGADPKMWAEALKIHRKAIIVDGHNDIPSPLTDDDFDLATNSVGMIHATDGTAYHTDLARFKASGITGEFFSIYVGGDTWKAVGRCSERWT
jgi:membrane dipeptidase